MDSKSEIPPQIELTEEMRQEIRGACAEVDPEQMAIIARMTPAERMLKGFRLSNTSRRVAVARYRQQHPELSEAEAQRILLARYYDLESRDAAR
jgi:hypothetical protein